MALDALARERVMGELEKALCKAEKPSIFFRELRRMDQLGSWFEEAAALIGVPQPAKYHPEGDVWTHTLQVLDEAAALRGEARQPLWFMLAALCHDLGKPVSTELIDGEYHAYRHEIAGLRIVRELLERLTGEVRLKEYVLNMVELHMAPNAMACSSARRKSYMKLFDRSCCPEDLLLLAKADFLGCRGPEQTRGECLALYAPTEEKLRALLADFRELMARPYLMGRDLVAAGMEPGPDMSAALEYAHKLRLAGLSKEDQLRQTLGIFGKT
jgi:tRNA nucleotidyltransferase (CCA-adding enzyme)